MNNKERTRSCVEAIDKFLNPFSKNDSGFNMMNLLFEEIYGKKIVHLPSDEKQEGDETHCDNEG